MLDEMSAREPSLSGADDDSQTPQSSPAPTPAKSIVSSVDGVADLIARRKAMEEEEQSDDSDQDVADIYALTKQRLLGNAVEKPSASVAVVKPAPVARSTASDSQQSPPSSSKQATSPAADSDSDVPVASKKRGKPVRLFETDSEGESSAAESDKSENLPSNSRLQQLITERRLERQRKEQEAAQEAKEAAEAANRSKTPPARSSLERELDGEENVVDHAVEDKLTQQSRPTRKASKKAIEEMNKETQRMQRNMQLTHQAKVKTKFSIHDFAARFTAKTSTDNEESLPTHSSSALNSSDNEADAHADTPPSSPPSEHGKLDLGKSVLGSTTTAVPEDDDAPLPSLEEILTQCLTKPNKGKAVEVVPEPVSTKRKLSPRRYRITPIVAAQVSTSTTIDLSDDELDVVKEPTSIFDEVQPHKASESRAFLHLRHLANINNHEVAGKGKKGIPTITAAQLDAQLRKKAALQARQERDEKIAELLAKGIVVQTAEEKERDMMEVENLLEKARAEAEELRKNEKAKDKAEREEMGIEASDDESDDEWMEGDGEDDEVADDEAEDDEDEELELSGSEDEEMDEEDNEEEGPAKALFDDAAEETEAESEDLDAEDQAEIEDTQPLEDDAQPIRKAGRKRFVVEDDEDEDETEVVPTAPLPQTRESSEEPGPVEDIAAAFGFGAAPMALMSPSQMFAGTMGASQTQLDPTQEQDSMDLFNRMVPPTMSPRPETPMIAPRSQSMQQYSLSTPSATRLDDTQALRTPAIIGFSQMSDVPTPSQDMGFSQYRQELRREVSVSIQSTVDTVLLSVPESPIRQKRGRLHRRKISDRSDSAEDDAPSGTAAKATNATAFDVMRKAAAKPPAPDFDKKKSDAKNMIEEQAEESEDEYAGLGGASDDESVGEADELDRQMIDESEVHVDERKMAAYYAEKERAENEAQTNKLYKDIMSGNLRRQRGDAFDLDSDEDDQIAERRRRKQREEARKRRLLLGDENLGKFSGNDKKEAFLRAIEDRDDAIEAETDLLDGHDVNDMVPDSQPNASQDASQQPLQEIASNATKRKADTDYDGPFKRPRRPVANAAFVKPASLADVRASVSFLVDEPHAEPSPSQDLADDEDEDETVPERPHFSARRVAAPVVDRLLLQRKASSSSSASEGMAFLPRSASGSFRTAAVLGRQLPPSMRREASTKSTSSSEGRASGLGRGKKSSIAYAAREAERRAVVDAVERRRKEDVKRIAGMRTGGGLGGWAGGFE